jgi:uncharacterized protein YeaC (DUF1315 family)
MNTGIILPEFYDTLGLRQQFGLPPIGKPLTTQEQISCMMKLMSTNRYTLEQCATICMHNICKHDGWNTQTPPGTYLVFNIDPVTQILQWIAFVL